MDAGVIALWIVGILVGLFVIGGILSWLSSFYYFDHR